jgi:hypothetical protein
MCSSACKHAHPRSPCHCPCHRRYHGMYYGRRPYSDDYAARNRRTDRPRYIFASERPSEPKLVQPRIRQLTVRQIVRSVVIGLSCGAFPTGSPAIVAFGRLTDVLRTARGLVTRLTSNQDTVAGTVQSLATYLAAEAAAHVIGPWSRAVSYGIASKLPTSRVRPESVRTLVSSTVSNVMSEGVAGLVAWEIGN